MDNIVENNKLIAEFMGWKENKDMEVKLTSGGITYYFQKNDEACIPETMCYHSDWNWLKLVLEKISYLNKDNFSDETKQALEDLLSLSLFSAKENVYKSIINFIKTIK